MWILGVTSLEVHSLVFNITKPNNNYAIYTPGFCKDHEAVKKVDELMEQES